MGPALLPVLVLERLTLEKDVVSVVSPTAVAAVAAVLRVGRVGVDGEAAAGVVSLRIWEASALLFDGGRRGNGSSGREDARRCRCRSRMRRPSPARGRPPSPS
jgi:hypothetical protein